MSSSSTDRDTAILHDYVVEEMPVGHIAIKYGLSRQRIADIVRGRSARATLAARGPVAGSCSVMVAGAAATCAYPASRFTVSGENAGRQTAMYSAPSAPGVL